MIKVLVITYYWPPSGGSGVQRWMYFCKHLKDFGIEPVVLTVDEKEASYRTTDPSLVGKVSDVRVYKTKTFELLKFYSYLTTGDSKKGIPQGSIGGNSFGIINKLIAFIRGNIFVPDARVGWKSYAISKALDIINANEINHIITTGPPHSTHLIGLALKNKLPHLKWLADFRDPWTEIYYNKYFYRTKRTIRKDASFEWQVLTKADLVLTIGKKLQEMLAAKIPYAKNKFKYIYNGYDSFLMDQTPREKQSHFEITFIGLLTESQPYESFIDILTKFNENNPDANFKVCLAGQIQEVVIEKLKEKLPEGKILHVGYVSHQDSLRLMKRSQLLINLLANMKESQILISGKQMEYIATGNPILCLGNKNGESAMILGGIPNAKVYEQDEVLDSVSFMQQVFNKWKKNIDFRNSIDAEIMKNSRYQLTGKLSELIKEM